jgi:hypothetical protein
VLTVRDVEDFVWLLPEWERVRQSVRTVLLAQGSDCDGWYRDGIVAICAWPRELWLDVRERWRDEHAAVLARLDVPIHGTELRFSQSQVRAFQLLHILLHELGHHVDRHGGEPAAERYAYRWEAEVWNRYVDRFGWPTVER